MLKYRGKVCLSTDALNALNEPGVWPISYSSMRAFCVILIGFLICRYPTFRVFLEWFEPLIVIYHYIIIMLCENTM